MPLQVEEGQLCKGLSVALRSACRSSPPDGKPKAAQHRRDIVWRASKGGREVRQAQLSGTKVTRFGDVCLGPATMMGHISTLSGVTLFRRDRPKERRPYPAPPEGHWA